MKKDRIIKIVIIILSILVGAFAVVCVPLIINYCYLENKIFETVWDGAELLGYYGSILGAVATIIAVVMTIKFTIKNQKEEKKLSIRPYLQTNIIYFSDFDEDTSIGNIKVFNIAKDSYLSENIEGIYVNLSDKYYRLIDIIEFQKNQSKFI